MSPLDRMRNFIQRGDATGSAESVFVIGLGRFGSAVARRLVELDVEVMAIDLDMDLVNSWADRLTHVRHADATSPTVLTQLGVSDFDATVVAIGTDIEASILATAALSDLGVNSIWAKAMTDEHGRILKRVGAHEVVFPERQMGERVAQRVTGQVVDYFQLDDGYVLAEHVAPASLQGVALSESNIRQDYGVTVVCVKPLGSAFTYATPDTVLGAGDLLLVAGTIEDANRFAAYASSPTATTRSGAGTATPAPRSSDSQEDR